MIAAKSMKCSLNSPPKWMVCIDLLLDQVDLNEGVRPSLYVNRIFHVLLNT